MTQIILIVLLALASMLLYVRNIAAYDSDNVHPQINEEASRQSMSLGIFLQGLGFNTGVEGVLNGKAIYKWFREGGTKEDAPIYRANNHFHDPLKAWSSAGLSGNYLGLSSLVWAQDQSLLGPSVGGDWSWRKARSLCYDALSSKDRSIGERKYADTFRALGQMMHLIADASVPAHTRNDMHVFPLGFAGITFGKRQTYESWAQREWRGLNYTAKNIDPSIFNRAVTDSSAGIPVSALWDQNKYTGSNPEVTWTTSPAILEYGLAEYSNANYFSEDTIFTDYPHPKKEKTTTTLVEQYAKDGKLDKTWYIMGYQSEQLAAYSYFWDNSGLVPEAKWLYHLDNSVYRSYSKELLPRAVGYSAGLLNYFFRGSLEIAAPSSSVYSVTDGSKIPQQFTAIRAKVKNTTPNEAMTEGMLVAVARYKVVPNYSPDLSNYPPDGTVMQGIPYSHSVSAPRPLLPEELASMNVNPTEFTFDFTADPIPAGITDLYLQIVFRGTLGNEKDIAIAVGMKDLMEPTHHLYWNSTDMFSLYGHLYTAQQIRDDPNLSSLAAGAYIDPEEISLEFGYMGESPPLNPWVTAARVDNLPAGRHVRLILLVDRQADNYVRISWRSAEYPTEKHGEVWFPGAQYEDTNGAWNSTPVTSFRTVIGHLSKGVLACKPLTSPCPYPEEEAIIPVDLTPYDQAILNFP